MSFLPENLTPAFRSLWYARAICSRGDTSLENISHSDGHSIFGCRRKQKEPITQSTKNRRERGSRFKMMFYVIGSEDQSRVLLSYCSRQQNQRRDGAVRYFRSVPMLCRIAPTSLLWVEHIFIQLLCRGVPLCHYYTDNALCRQGCKPSHYIRNFKRQISTVAEKFSLPVRTFLREISMGKK